MVLKIICCIILTAVLGIVICLMFAMTFNLFCDKEVECFGEEKEIAASSKYKVIGIDILSLYVAYSIVRYMHIYDLFYKVFWSRMDNNYVDSVISVFTVVPLMLVISRWIINKVMDYSEVAAYEGKIVLTLALGTPFFLLMTSLVGGATYVVLWWLLPIYLMLWILGGAAAAPLMALPFAFGFFDFVKLFGFTGVFLFVFAGAVDEITSEFPTFKNQIVSGYAAADRKPIFTIGKYDEKKYDWKAFAQAQDKSFTFYYDESSVSLDDKNGIATVLIKRQKGKEMDLSRAVISFKKDSDEMLVTDTWSNTVALSLSNSSEASPD